MINAHVKTQNWVKQTPGLTHWPVTRPDPTRFHLSGSQTQFSPTSTCQIVPLYFWA